MQRHLSAFEQRLAAGAPRLGFKVAFNAPAAQQKLGLPFALAAGLSRETLVQPPCTIPLSGMTSPAVEAEVAVWLDADLPAGSSEAQAIGAVRAWAPAIEVVDFDRPLTELEDILAEGVFHRAVVLGEPSPTAPGADLSGITARVCAGSSPPFEVDALSATGQVSSVLLHIASILSPLGAGLCGGDVVILGAMNPLTPARPGERFAFSLEGVGELAVDFA